VQAIYLRTWDALPHGELESGSQRYCRGRLRTSNVVHIFGLYDLLGPAWPQPARNEAAIRARAHRDVRANCAKSLAERMYHSIWGRKTARGASAVIATSEQEKLRDWPPADLLARGCAASEWRGKRPRPG